MFEKAWEQGTLNYKLLLWQVHNDIQTAVMFLSPPVFDPDGWLLMVYAPLEKEARLHTAQLDRCDSDPDPSIEGELAQYFRDVRAIW